MENIEETVKRIFCEAEISSNRFQEYDNKRNEHLAILIKEGEKVANERGYNLNLIEPDSSYSNDKDKINIFLGEYRKVSDFSELIPFIPNEFLGLLEKYKKNMIKYLKEKERLKELYDNICSLIEE